MRRTNKVVPIASITSFYLPPGPSNGSTPEESRCLMPHDGATEWQHGMNAPSEHIEQLEPTIHVAREQASSNHISRQHRGQPQMQVVIEVQGKEFALGAPTDIQIAKALDMARVYGHCLFREPPSDTVNVQLSSALARLRIQFSRQEAERAALEDAAEFSLTAA